MRSMRHTSTMRAVCALWSGCSCLLLLLLLSAPQVSQAQDRDPTTGYDRFPQFRNLSGLAGSGFGVDEKGYPSLSGPTAFSTPVAFVLGHDHARIVGGRASFTSGPDIFGNPNGPHGSNGSAFGMFGHTFGRYNVALTDMLISERLDQSFHLQVQYISSPNTPWTVSLGAQDIGGGGGASGFGFPGDSRLSRSLFSVATYRWDGLKGLKNPLYVSGGIGTRRFRQGFGSVSYQFMNPLRGFLEHDGFGLNAGALFTTRSGAGRQSLEYTGMLAYQRLRYFVASVGIGF